MNREICGDCGKLLFEDSIHTCTPKHIRETPHEEVTDTLLAARERIEHLTICGAALQAENDKLQQAVAHYELALMSKQSFISHWDDARKALK